VTAANLMSWLPSAVIALVAVLATLLVGRIRLRRLWRRAGPAGPDRRAVRAILAEVAILVGTLPWVALILTPQPSGNGSVHLIPFTDIIGQIRLSWGFLVVQTVGNLLVFAALGFFAPIRWRIGTGRVALIAAVFSTTLEILQHVQHTGRVASIDDVWENTAGAVLFALAARPFWARRQWPAPHDEADPELTADGSGELEPVPAEAV
jgi:VanZ like family